MKKNGFTLIELMITVAIVAIVAAIAIPSYTAFVRQANRTDATKTMMLDAQSLERCYSQAFTYTGCAVVPASATTPLGYYTVTTNFPTANTYTITAVPIKAPQLTDSQCMQFTLNNAGTQAALNSASTDNTKTCWGST